MRAEQLLRFAVAGVGRNKELRETTGCSVQLRRLASEDEMRIIGPAIDTR